MDDDDDDSPPPPRQQEVKPPPVHTPLTPAMASPIAAMGSPMATNMTSVVQSTGAAPTATTVSLFTRHLSSSTTDKQSISLPRLQVDLTLSDSDEEQPPARTPVRSQPTTPAAMNPRVNSNGAACSRPTSGGKPNGMFNLLMNSNYFD